MINKTQLLLLLVSILTLNTINAQWTQKGIDIDGETIDDRSGDAVSLSSDGETIAIGAPGNAGSFTGAGHVRIYNWNVNTWVQMGADIEGEDIIDFSGESVSLSSDGLTVAIGATGNDGNGSNSGHVKIYNWNGSSWIQRGDNINGEAAHDRSSYSISLSSDGNTVAIGAIGNSDNGSYSGHVRIYQWNGASWIQLGNDIDGEAANDWSGRAVSLSSDGQIVAIGAWQNAGNGNNSGHVRIYSWNGSSWGQLGFDIDGEAEGDLSGHSVSLSSNGQTVAIGASDNSDNGNYSGHIRIYNWNGVSWVQLGSDIDGEAANDRFGTSVSLSSDGLTVAIGAPGNTGNGNSSGHVRIYNWSGSAWLQLETDIDGEAILDRSGSSVSLSSDGKTVAIGAPNNNGNGSNSGHVRVFEIVANCPIPTALTVNNVTSNSADLAWMSSGTSWDIEFGAEGFIPTGIPTITSLSTNPYNLSGLTANTAYDFYVRNDCDLDSLSAWAGPFNFTTVSNVGVNVVSNHIGLSLYPNPNSGIFTLSFKAQNVSVKVISMMGEVLLIKNNVNTNEYIDLTNHATGIYFVTVTSNDIVTTQKVKVQ